YPSISWSDISQDQEPPEGWPRPPKFNDPGDVPGPPVQYGDPVKPDNVKGGFGFKDNGVEEKNLYFYHPDHLGSSSYITDRTGKISQHTEYIAFGEVLFDEHTTEVNMPYLFNGKELDQETGLYYYGARYYDPRVSIFLNVDPLVEKTMQPYAYTNNNPIMLIDPTGMEGEGWIEQLQNGKKTYTYNPNINTISDAKLVGYNNVTNVYSSANVSMESILGMGGYSYSLNSDGSVTDNQNNPIYNSFVTKAGTTINAPNGSFITQWDGDRGILGNWANSEGILGQLSYGVINNFYLAAQVVDFDLLGKDHVNPLTGSRAYTNLDGTPQYDSGERAIAFSGAFNPVSPKFLPASSLRVSKDILTPLTASQFSKLFKGTSLARATPKVRGNINRGINKVLNKINNVNTLKNGTVGSLKPLKEKEK
uniref:RHS repeat domain-containing protein n=1 Tax=Riemerella columbina TaxID=103810 RepID=UPI00068841ED